MQSMKTLPSRSQTRQPSPRAAQIGYGFINTVVRVLPPGRLASARSYIFCEEELESGYMRLPNMEGQALIAAGFLPANRSFVRGVLRQRENDVGRGLTFMCIE